LNAGGGTHLWALVAREYWRRFRRRLRTSPIHRFRYAGRTPERVLLAPPDLRHADPRIATQIYHGVFPLCGRVVEAGGVSPFLLDVSELGWRKSLHGFRWLRHMRAAGTDLAAANARALVSEWITSHGGRIDGIAWEPATTAKRIIAWLQHSTVVLQGADFRFYRAFLRSLALQIRYLRSMAREMPPGEDRLRARVALAYAALSLPAPPSALRHATQALCEELDKQILPDGGHVSRNPMALMELLADLLPLRQTFASQAEAPPPALLGAIDRMLPALRFFRMGDGGIARFNGMGVTIRERLAAILRHDDAGGAPLLHAPHSGYERLAMGSTTVVADTGRPPPPDLAGDAHAGCLSFEMSSGRHLMIVNAGVDTFGASEFRPLGRATAAHSTATLGDTSSAKFHHTQKVNELIGAPLLGGPQNVPVERSDTPATQAFVARHDGYAQTFGLVHERRMILSENGRVLDGFDRFPAVSRNAGAPVMIRFHLHPDVHVARHADSRILITLQSGDTWAFDAPPDLTRIEDSIFFAAQGGPRRTRQIVLAFEVPRISEVGWRFSKTER